MSSSDQSLGQGMDGRDSSRVWAFDASRIPWQKEFVECTDHEVMGDGAFGSGKTRALGEKVYMNLALYPGNRGLLARKTFSSIENTTLQTFLDEVVPDSHVVGTNKQRHLIQVQSPYYPTAYCVDCGWETASMVPVKRRQYVLEQCPACGSVQVQWTPPSELYYEGLSTDGSRPGEMPEKIAGMNLGFVAVDEAIEITEKDWEMLQGRLRLKDLANPYVKRLPFRQIFCVTNPDTPSHWLHRRFIERGVGTRVSSSTEDNPFNPDDYLDRLRQQFAGADFERFVKGDWVGRQGLVYSDFSEGTHVIEPLQASDLLGDGWSPTEQRRQQLVEKEREVSTQTGDPGDKEEYLHHGITPPEGDTPGVFMAVDWGYRPDPAVVQWWARHHSYGWVLYRELFQTRTLPGDLVEEAVDRMARHELESLRAVYADHDSGDRSAWLEGARDAVSEKFGDSAAWRRLRTTSAQKDRLDGVKRCMREMRPSDDGRPGIHFIRGSRAHPPDHHLVANDRPSCTLQEIRGYGWKSDMEEDPQDDHDHGMDAMRYLVYSHHRKGGSSGSENTAVFKS